MNHAQRNFLIKKIQESSDTTVKILRSAIPKPPNLSNYLLHAVMSNNFEIKSNEEIKEMIRQKALNAETGRDNWMGTRSAFNSQNDLAFKPYDFFIIPEEYQKLYEEYKAKEAEINNKIGNMLIQTDTLITRIQLASDKTLQTMINEVDNMGDISLIETKLKLLN